MMSLRVAAILSVPAAIIIVGCVPSTPLPQPPRLRARISLTQDPGEWDDWTTMSLEPIRVTYTDWTLGWLLEGHTYRPLGAGGLVQIVDLSRAFALGQSGFKAHVGIGAHVAGPSAPAVEAMHVAFDGYDPYKETPDQVSHDSSFMGELAFTYAHTFSPSVALRALVRGQTSGVLNSADARIAGEFRPYPSGPWTFALSLEGYRRSVQNGDPFLKEVFPTAGAVLGLTAVNEWAGGRHRIGFGMYRGWDWGEKLPSHGSDPHPVFGLYYEHCR